MGTSKADKEKLDWQRLLPSLWAADSDQQFAAAWTELAPQMNGFIRGALERTIKRPSKFLAGPRPRKTLDDLLIDEAMALALENLWHAVLRMRHQELARVESPAAFRRYAEQVAEQAWNATLRAKNRDWNKVYRAVVRLIELNPERLSRWDHRLEKRVVGLTAWQGLPPIANPPELADWCLDALSRAVNDVTTPRLADRLNVCVWLLETVGNPVRLFDLVSALDHFERQLAVHREAPVPPPWNRLHYAETYQLCWEAFLQLNVQQRRVLLLKWPELTWFEIYCQVSVETVASALELPLSQLLDLDRRLPLADEEISALTGLKISSLRNLRSEALKIFRQKINELLGKSASYLIAPISDELTFKHKFSGI